MLAASSNLSPLKSGNAPWVLCAQTMQHPQQMSTRATIRGNKLSGKPQNKKYITLHCHRGWPSHSCMEYAWKI